jgi:hypothetical protein
MSPTSLFLLIKYDDMKTITKAQSEALTKFGVEHTGKESIKEASDLLHLAIYEVIASFGDDLKW